MKRATTQRAKELSRYRRLKAKFLATHHVCVFCNNRVPDRVKSLHHYFGRAGTLLCYEPGFRLTHTDCHALIETHRNEAVKLGLRAPNNLFNLPSKVIPK